MNHPLQPIILDDNKQPRFKENAIVRYMKDQVGLNKLAALDFPQEDWEQLAQLIGYSLSGFGETTVGLFQVTESGFVTVITEGPTLSSHLAPQSVISWDPGYPLQSGLPWVICTMNADVPYKDLGGEEFYCVIAMRRRLNQLLSCQDCPLIRVFYGLTGHRILVETYNVPANHETDRGLKVE